MQMLCFGIHSWPNLHVIWQVLTFRKPLEASVKKKHYCSIQSLLTIAYTFFKVWNAALISIKNILMTILEVTYITCCSRFLTFVHWKNICSGLRFYWLSFLLFPLPSPLPKVCCQRLLPLQQSSEKQKPACVLATPAQFGISAQA